MGESPTASRQYYHKVADLLDRVHRSQGAAISRAGRMVADALAEGRMLYVTGSGHSHMLAEEIFYRAGGLVAVHPILTAPLMLHDGALRSSHFERLEGVAETLLDHESLGEGDVLVVASNSGRNAYPVEMALGAQKRGAKVIAITSMEHSRQVSSRHGCGKKLYELADVVLDNCGAYGDAAVTLQGLECAVGPTSTIAGVFLIQSVVLTACELLLQQGHRPEVFESANVERQSAPPVDVGAWKKRIRFL